MITYKGLLGLHNSLDRLHSLHQATRPSAPYHFFHDDICLEKISLELHTQQCSKCIFYFVGFALHRIPFCGTMVRLPMYQFLSGTSPCLWSSAQLSLCLYSNNDPPQDNHTPASIWIRSLPTARPLCLLPQVNRLVNHLFQHLAYFSPLGQLFLG